MRMSMPEGTTHVVTANMEVSIGKSILCLVSGIFLRGQQIRTGWVFTVLSPIRDERGVPSPAPEREACFLLTVVDERMDRISLVQ